MHMKMLLFSLLVFLNLSLDLVVAEGEMESAVDERRQETHVIDSLDLLLYVCLLILTVVTVWVFKQRRVRYLHESGLAIVYGLLVGLVLRLIGTTREISRIKVIENPLNLTSVSSSDGDLPATPPDTVLLKYNVSAPDNDDATTFLEKIFTYTFQSEFTGDEDHNEIQARATFNPELFFYVLLPPIIFFAGYGMHRKHFFDNFGAIMLFACVGTTISTFVVATIMYFLSIPISDTVPVRFLDALFFGAVISATDPVTVLSIFHDLHVDSTLNGLILGESLLNDAVAVVLVAAIEEYTRASLTQGDSFELDALLVTLIRLCIIVVGSIGLGALVAMVTAILTKFTKLSEYPLLETSLFTLMSYSSYLLAEINEMSGIVAVLFCGISQAHYTYSNLSVESRQRTTQFFELLNFLSENFIFSYIGVSMFTFTEHVFSVLFIVGAFCAIAVARAMNVYPLGLLANLGRREGHKIPLNFLNMMWFSGLRGAIAFALSVQNTVTPVRRMIFTTTSIIAIVTVIFNGGLTTTALAFFMIPVGVRDNERDILLEDDVDDNGSGSGSPTSGSKKSRSPVAQGWSKFDKKFLKPMLTSAQPSLVQTLPEWCFPFALCFTSREQLSSEEEMEVVVAHNSNGGPGSSNSGSVGPPMQMTKRSDSNNESLISGD